MMTVPGDSAVSRDTIVRRNRSGTTRLSPSYAGSPRPNPALADRKALCIGDAYPSACELAGLQKTTGAANTIPAKTNAFATRDDMLQVPADLCAMICPNDANQNDACRTNAMAAPRFRSPYRQSAHSADMELCLAGTVMAAGARCRKGHRGAS